MQKSQVNSSKESANALDSHQKKSCEEGSSVRKAKQKGTTWGGYRRNEESKCQATPVRKVEEKLTDDCWMAIVGRVTVCVASHGLRTGFSWVKHAFWYTNVPQSTTQTTTPTSKPTFNTDSQPQTQTTEIECGDKLYARTQIYTDLPTTNTDN